jgi:hypothetical protein
MGTEHTHSSGSHPELNHETTDVNLTGITRIAIASLVIIVIVFGIVYLFEKVMARVMPDTTTTPTMANWKPADSRLPKVPLVVTDEPGLLRKLRAEEDQALHRYAWIDKSQGVVRVPIDKALEMVASNPKLLAPEGGAPAAPAPAPEAGKK